MVYSLRRCMSGRGLCYVTSDGTAFPRSNASGNKILAGGNLLERSFEDIWNDDLWPILRREELFRELIYEEPRITNEQVKMEALGTEKQAHVAPSQQKLVYLGGKP
jgi:MoaA/NifB/PqqE/SkfB family radical SAM enzyme